MSNREQEILNADENHHAILRQKLSEILELAHQWMQSEVASGGFAMTLKAELLTAKEMAKLIGGTTESLYKKFSQELQNLLDTSRDAKQFKVVVHAAQDLSNALERY